MLVCAVAFAATSADEPSDEVFRGFQDPEVDAAYVIGRGADEVLRDGFVDSTLALPSIVTDTCFGGSYALTPPKGFVAFDVTARAQLTPTGDSSTYRILEVLFIEARYSTAFYGELSWESSARASAALDSITTDSVVRMMERDVVLPLRIGARPRASVWLQPCQ